MKKLIWKLCGISPKWENTIMDVLGEDKYCGIMSCATGHTVCSLDKSKIELDAFLFHGSPEMLPKESKEFSNALGKYLFEQFMEYRKHGFAFTNNCREYWDAVRHYTIDEPEVIWDYIRKEKEREQKLKFLKGENSND